MKKFFAWIFLPLFLAGSVAWAAEKLSSEDWKKITRQRKIYFVLGSMETFQEKGTIFRHAMDEYIGWMDQAASRGDSPKDMSEVFSELVSARETA